MKKVIALLLTVIFVFAMTISAFADGMGTQVFTGQGNVKKGTPVIDGKLDDLYTDSLILGGHPDYTGKFLDTGDVSSIVSQDKLFVYALWDASALYFFVVCYDPTIGSGDRVSFMPVFNSNVCNVDISLASGEVHFGDYGGYNESASHILSGVNGDKGYTWVEAKLVLSDDVKGGVLYANNPVQFHAAYWNDINNDGADDNYSTTGFFAQHHVKLVGSAAAGTAGSSVEIAAGDNGGQTNPDTTPVNPHPVNPQPGPNPPQTSDSIVIVSAAALCAAAAAIIIAKKKRA